MKTESKAKIVKEMEECPMSELRLWLIQELSVVDTSAIWLLEEGIKILAEKQEASGNCEPQNVHN